MKKYPAQIRKFGKRIKSLREENDLTQKELGVKAGLTSRTIQRIEAGDFASTLHILIALAKAFSVSTGELIKEITVEPAKK